MLKCQKLEYQQQVEKHLEEHQIYDIFEELMKGLLKEKPPLPKPAAAKAPEKPKVKSDAPDKVQDKPAANAADDKK